MKHETKTTIIVIIAGVILSAILVSTVYMSGIDGENKCYGDTLKLDSTCEHLLACEKQLLDIELKTLTVSLIDLKRCYE